MAEAVVTIKISKVTPSRAGIGEMLNDDALRRKLRPIAERVAAQARATAPVDSGQYRDSIHVESDTTDRVVERVVADAPHAMVVESRTGNLARALSAAGR